jgi:uncharacterized protein YndB with AHSA1/START domain
MGTVVVERSVSIARPPSDVFAFVSDIRNDPKWHTDVLEARASGEPIGVGTVFEVKVKPSMGVSGGTMTVAEFEPPRRLVLQGRMGKMEPRVSYTVEQEGSGARYTRMVEIPTKGVMGLMAPMMKRMIGKANDGFLANLKRVLESR